MEIVGERPPLDAGMFRLSEIRDGVFELEDQELKESMMGEGEAKKEEHSLKT